MSTQCTSDIHNINSIAVVLTPSDEFVSVPGGTAVFLCTTSLTARIEMVEWMINGISLEDLSINNNIMPTLNPIGAGVGILMFTDLQLDFNMTSVLAMHCTF